MISKILDFPRKTNRKIAFLSDTLTLLFSLIFVMSLSSGDFYFPSTLREFILFGSTIFISLIAFNFIGLYDTLVRFLSLQSFITITLSSLTSTICFYLLSTFAISEITKSQIIFYGMTTLICLSGTRLTFRLLVHEYKGNSKEKVIIYGAGSAARQLVSAISNGEEYLPIALIDDNPDLHYTKVSGITVYPRSQINILINEYHIRKVLLAIASTTPQEKKSLLDFLERFPVKVKTIPGMADVVEGKASINEIQDISIHDLLGREPVEPNKQLMQSNITGKNVLVTGAGGSIGSELCRQIIQCNPKRVVLFDVSEFSLYTIDQELCRTIKTQNLDIELCSLLGSVQHKNRMKSIMSAFKIHTVYHAAAYKHVPIVEENVIEGVRNNVFGTFYCAEAALETNVERFVLVSTDKAVRPTNIMGTTKRLAELTLQSLAQKKSNTIFCMVRFGNVLGSSGSVVPLFREQIKAGGPVTVTHKDITRYFMTIPEASQLVLQAGAMGIGGDVFVLDMGEPVKIYDLAKQMIKLSGFTVKTPESSEGQIEINFSGLRPGEKLYEELLIGDDVEGSMHPRIMTASEISLTPEQMDKVLHELDIMCHQFDVKGIRELMLKTPTGFKPSDDICDLLWKNNNKKINSDSNILSL